MADLEGLAAAARALGVVAPQPVTVSKAVATKYAESATAQQLVELKTGIELGLIVLIDE